MFYLCNFYTCKIDFTHMKHFKLFLNKMFLKYLKINVIYAHKTVMCKTNIFSEKLQNIKFC